MSSLKTWFGAFWAFVAKGTGQRAWRAGKTFQDLSASVVSPVQIDDVGVVVTQNSSDAAMFQDAKYLCIC